MKLNFRANTKIRVGSGGSGPPILVVGQWNPNTCCGGSGANIITLSSAP